MPIPYPQLLVTCNRVRMILVNFVNFLIKTLRVMFVTGFLRSYSYIKYEKFNSCYFIFKQMGVLLSRCLGFPYCENPQNSLRKRAFITHLRLCTWALSLQGSCHSISLIRYLTFGSVVTMHIQKTRVTLRRKTIYIILSSIYLCDTIGRASPMTSNTHWVHDYDVMQIKAMAIFFVVFEAHVSILSSLPQFNACFRGSHA